MHLSYSFGCTGALCQFPVITALHGDVFLVSPWEQVSSTSPYSTILTDPPEVCIIFLLVALAIIHISNLSPLTGEAHIFRSDT